MARTRERPRSATAGAFRGARFGVAPLLWIGPWLACGFGCPSPVPGPAAARASSEPAGEATAPARPAPAEDAPTPPPSPYVIQVTVGDRVSCALLEGGEVRCWGTNADGRAGLGELPYTAVPTAVAGLPPARAIALGDTHGCAIDATGEVHCWGDNGFGQLGDGTTVSRPTPARVAGLRGIAEVAAGAHHSCARSDDGRVRCWGRALHVGDGSAVDRPRPTPLAGVREAASVVLGRSGGCVILRDRTLRCWGFNSSGIFGARPGPLRAPVPVLDVPVSAIALGDRHVCIVLDDGHIECAGSNRGGELADQNVPDGAWCETRDGTVTCTFDEPASPPRPPAPGSPPRPYIHPPPPPERRIETRTYPEHRGFERTHWTGHTVVADWGYASSRTCMIIDDRVHCFGSVGTDGWSHRRARPIEGTDGAVALDVSSGHGCAVRRDRTAVCWGRNDSGELGDGTTTARATATPVRW